MTDTAAPPDDRMLWDIATTAKNLSISEAHLYRMVRNNDIPYARVGRLLRFRPAELSIWLTERGVPARRK